MSSEVRTQIAEGVQVHNLYGEVAVLSQRDRMGRYVDEELETFRSDDSDARFRIEALPAADFVDALRPVSELRGIRYLINPDTGEQVAALRHVYWRFDELGRKHANVYYGAEAHPALLWRVLEQWMKIAFLQRGWVPVHSSSFVYRDVPVVVAGWQDLGKSRLLHYALGRGAEYVSEDFTWISPAGELRGYPAATVDVDDGHYPGIHKQLARSPVGAIRRRIARSIGRAPRSPRLVKRIGRRLGAANGLRVRMEELYPGVQTAKEGDRLLWIVILPSANRPEPVTCDATPEETVARIVSSTLTDFYFSEYYDKYLYQCGRRAEHDHLILNARSIHIDLIGEALSHARGIWTVDSSTVLSEPGRLLDLVADTSKR